MPTRGQAGQLTMTITFRVDGLNEETGHDLPCPDCGLTLATAHLSEHQDPDCSCLGYGGPDVLPAPRYALNVATVNGVDLLRALGLPGTSVGSADPRDILTALVTSEGIEDRYREILERIAVRAARWDRAVVWD